MLRGRSYTGIDAFRVAAAVMIIAIHTYPLASYNETADFILVHIVCRVAVPFFFMASGFFLFQKGTSDPKRLARFLRKTSVIYGIAIVLYLPVNIYTGYFQTEHFLVQFLRDLLLDGTFYHLWYLPAAIAGALIAWICIKHFGKTGAVLVTAALYLIGLLGDSYFGLTERVPLLNGIYANLFDLFDQTRNGLFFAPLFFALGAAENRKYPKLSMPGAFAGFTASMAFMIGEGLLLHNYRMQRHDSMYVMLIPCMFFLFYLLKSIRGRRLKYVAELSLVVYIIHPLLILLVRMFAKFAEIEELLIYNSLIHFGATCIASVAAACFILRVKHFAAPKKKKQFRRVTAEINTRSLRQNVRILRGWMHEDCKIMAVVKADAYGHGAVPVSCVLNEEGVDAFAVATLEEAVSLRRGGVDGKILILGYTDPCQVRKIRRYRLTQTVVSKEHACRLNQKRTRIDVHIKIDTGMHRVGIDVEQLSAIEKVFHLNYLHVTGMYTHLCVSDSLQENDVNFTLEQICKMDDCIRQLQEKRITIPEVHVQSSSGLYCYPYLSYSYVRAGIALYGVASSLQNAMASATDLKPVMTLKSQIILVKNVPAGETVGYGRNFTAKRDTTVAVVCAGYADGIPRNLSQNGAVLIRGRRAPIVGSICMDQLMADVTDIPEAAVGDDVILFGRDGKEEISAESFAEASGSITNEILSRIGSRVERIYR